ncbi:MAG TPA: hypothetical protein VHG27_07670 [Xanthobacteraceae bacterium]|nr:hypothetical protein [Xanthobacteraceae bacterium]
MPEKHGGEQTATGSSDFDWVNAWAEQSRPGEGARAPDTGARHGNVHILHSAFVADATRAASAHDVAQVQAEAVQLARDIAAIAQARDALLSRTAVSEVSSREQGTPILLRRTADMVPVILGSMLGILMLILFSTAALFVKLAR